ncbi:hypothetical protein ACT16_06640 [Mycobacterium heckeshornense]|nr:hypothetical protein ACT16_06640 [Mycobacterium heckeshornense]
MGASDDGSNTIGPDAAADGQHEVGQQQQTGSSEGSDKGFPENTPVAEMTDQQKAAYFKYQNRKAEAKLAAFKGVTPEQLQQMQTELEQLRSEKLTADEKALQEATKKAAEEARAAAIAELRPKLLRSQLKSVASQILAGEQLDAWLDAVDASKFTGDDGDIDEEKVMGRLTAIFGTRQQITADNQKQRRWWGQHSIVGGSPPAKPGDAGRAEAAKRFGTKTT